MLRPCKEEPPWKPLIQEVQYATRRNMMIRKLSLSLSTVALIFAGCGGDKTNDDSMVQCGGHGQPACAGEIAFTDPDGGQVRIENLMLPDGTVNPLAHAHFIETTGTNETFIPLPGCTDVRAAKYFPFGSDMLGAAESSYVVPGRVLRDAGDTVELRDSKGSVMMSKVLDRGWISGSAFSIQYLPANSDQDPYGFGATDPEVIGGSGNDTRIAMDVIVPGLDLNIVGKLTLPARPVVTSPTMASFGVPAPTWEITRGQDITIAWETGRPEVPEGSVTAVVAYFYGMTGPNVICLVPESDGQITVSSAMVEKIDDMGSVFLQYLSHHIVDSDPSDAKRRLDLISTSCTSTNFMKVDP